MGGSQLNAIELAAAVRDLGHEVLIYGRPGTLLQRVTDLGLEFVESPKPGRRPSPTVVKHLRAVVGQRAVDVVHGYEWPPILEGRAATIGTSSVVAGTVMSMAVAPFIPFDLPLVVGTRQIAHHEEHGGRRHVTVLEPPVDVVTNAIDMTVDVRDFEDSFEIPTGLRVVVVSRLAHELKLEGLLTAITVVPTLAEDVVLVVVGGGPAGAKVDAAAAAANIRAGRRAVVVTGEVPDPRAAYAVADVCLGMGGSALRAMAFGKPLVVQGEQGFWLTLTPETFETFAWTGWYGVGPGTSTGRERLTSELMPLLLDGTRRLELGAYSRRTVVDRFSLDAAAHRQLALYEHLTPGPAGALGPADVRAAGALVRYKAGRVLGRLHQRRRSDDFNARPVALISNRMTPSAALAERAGEPR
jgi:glycosyltransferase involved in cell wall biosynthesis